MIIGVVLDVEGIIVPNPSGQVVECHRRCFLSE